MISNPYNLSTWNLNQRLPWIFVIDELKKEYIDRTLKLTCISLQCFAQTHVPLFLWNRWLGRHVSRFHVILVPKLCNFYPMDWARYIKYVHMFYFYTKLITIAIANKMLYVCIWSFPWPPLQLSSLQHVTFLWAIWSSSKTIENNELFNGYINYLSTIIYLFRIYM